MQCAQAMQRFAHEAQKKLRNPEQSSVGMAARAGVEMGAEKAAKVDPFAEDAEQEAENVSKRIFDGRAGQAGYGMGGGILGKILTIAAVPMVLIISVLTYGYFDSTVPTADLSDSANEAINKTNQNAYSGFNLASIIPIVIAGVTILSIVIGVFAYGFMRA